MFVPVDWDEALDDIAARLKDFRDNDGPDSLGVISCARATNEDNYAAQKFARWRCARPISITAPASATAPRLPAWRKRWVPVP